MIINTPAIVLKSFSYGDTSIIARCFSKTNGKVSLIVKGAKSKKSPKTSYFQPLSYIDIIYNYKPNRELQVLSKVNFREYWSRISEDLRTVSLAMSILEITEKTISPNDPHPALFTILKKVFQSYNNKTNDPILLFWFYECALLTNLGFQPNLENKNFPGLVLPDIQNGPNSSIILATLLSGNIDNIPKEKTTVLDRKIINEYLWKLLCYHFENLLTINSLNVVKKLLL